MFVKPETILMDIKFKNMQQLTLLRDLALESEFISEDIKNHSIPATLTYKGDRYKATINLFGTWLDHVNSEKFLKRY